VTRRLIVAITGASGAILGVRALHLLRDVDDVETHLIVSDGGRATLVQETGLSPAEVQELADVVHSSSNLGATISSGSFVTHGMLVAPCSVKTLSGIATCNAGNLVTRAADVILKERRRLVLMVRETPLHLGHIRLMSQVTEMGAIVMPPVPAFYTRPASVDDIVEQTVARALDQLKVETALVRRWPGMAESVRRRPDDGARGS
jgi:flavin prenyltransferase